jgi:hypothetical protein
MSSFWSWGKMLSFLVNWLNQECLSWVLEAHAYNPSYLGGGDPEDPSCTTRKLVIGLNVHLQIRALRKRK